MVFSFLSAVFLPIHEGVEPVLDHVLSSLFFQYRHQLAPSLAILSHKLENDNVLFRSPASSLLLLVEVVQPSFPAVLW